MKTPLILLKLVALVWLLVPTSAGAFYNPQTGRWLNRNPIEESGGVNLLALAGNDGPNRADACGLKLIVEGPCAEQLQIARDYLQCDVAREIFAQMDESPAEWHLACNNRRDDYVNRTAWKISWDPNGALEVGSSGEVQSPALGLLHELIHALFEGIPEQDVVALENCCAKDLGEGTRKTHWDCRQSFHVAAPNVCGPVPPRPQYGLPGVWEPPKPPPPPPGALPGTRPKPPSKWLYPPGAPIVDPPK